MHTTRLQDVSCRDRVSTNRDGPEGDLHVYVPPVMPPSDALLTDWLDLATQHCT